MKPTGLQAGARKEREMPWLLAGGCAGSAGRSATDGGTQGGSLGLWGGSARGD